MELLLTSYGISDEGDEGGLFYRMPPVSMSRRFEPGEGFQPDYAALLLCERIVVDGESLERFAKGAYYSAYRTTATLLRALQAEGFLRVADFSGILKAKGSLLSTMLKGDLYGGSVRWQQTVYEWAAAWDKFVSPGVDDDPEFDITGRVALGLSAEIGPVAFEAVEHLLALQAEPMAPISIRSHETLSAVLKGNRHSRKAATTALLAYVNANLVLAHELGVGVYDWSHFTPFYERKFLPVALKPPAMAEMSKVRQLFDVSFPDFVDWTPARFLQVIQDTRIGALRELVSGAVERDVPFDREFAIRTLREVLWIEARSSRIRNIISYATQPVGFIPLVGTPIQKAMEEISGRIVDHHFKKEFRWFFLISDMARDAPRLLNSPVNLQQ